LKDIVLLLTAVGCPGGATCIKYLKKVDERKVYIIGVDSNPEAIGRFLCDSFQTVPPANSSNYIEKIIDVIDKYHPDCMIPASSYDVNIISREIKRLDTNVLCSDIEHLEIANNKFLLYEKVKDDINIKIPDFILVKTLQEFLDAYRELDGDNRSLCFKPPFSKGSRGFRYIDNKINRKDLLLNYKPENKFISLSEFIDIFENDENFPQLLLMESIKGEEIDSMVLAMDGKCLLISHKTREKERSGVIIQGEQVVRENISESIRAIVKKIPLKYNFGIQFINGYLIEINPRLSTFMYQKDWIEPYFAIKLALGEFTKSDIIKLQNKIPIGLRMCRYFDQVFFRRSI